MKKNIQWQSLALAHKSHAHAWVIKPLKSPFPIALICWGAPRFSADQLSGTSPVPDCASYALCPLFVSSVLFPPLECFFFPCLL